MNRKYFLNRAIMRARLSRIFAKGIDLFIVLILCTLFYPVGLILSVIYLCVADSLQGGQSVGKKLVGFQVISLEDGSPCSVKQSSIRNLPFIIPVSFAIIPIVGIILGLIAGVALIALELIFIYKLDSGHRLGDVMADTSVVHQDGAVVQNTKKKNDSWFENQTPIC